MQKVRKKFANLVDPNLKKLHNSSGTPSDTPYYYNNNNYITKRLSKIALKTGALVRVFLLVKKILTSKTKTKVTSKKWGYKKLLVRIGKSSFTSKARVTNLTSKNKVTSKEKFLLRKKRQKLDPLLVCLTSEVILVALTSKCY